MDRQLRGKDLLLVGFTLFSMFFGAGNLIFPPFLGAQAGQATWIAMAGFALSAIGFPVLGVVAVPLPAQPASRNIAVTPVKMIRFMVKSSCGLNLFFIDLIAGNLLISPRKCL